MHLTVYQLNRYRQARLAPAELLSLDDHLSECEFCRQQLRAQLNLPAALLALQTNLGIVPEPAHLSPAQQTAFTNNTVNAVERELIVSHLESCASCAAHMQAYRAALLEPPASLGSALLAILDAWRERLALVWPMPVVAALVIAFVALADNVYVRTKAKPPANLQQIAVPRPSAAPVTSPTEREPALAPQPMPRRSTGWHERKP